MSTFSNIHHSESLAAWAIEHLEFPVSPEQESVLVHFQLFPRKEPDPAMDKRYLPFPKNLFDLLKIKQKMETGFWIDLDGVYEFIAYVPEQFLKEQSTDTIKAMLMGVSISVDDDLRKLRQQHKQNEKLYWTLQQFSAVEAAIKLYANREVVKQQTAETTLTQEEFGLYVEAYDKQFQIEAEFQEKRKQYERATASKEEAEKNAKDLANKIDQLKEYFDLQEVTPANIQAAIRHRMKTTAYEENKETTRLRKSTESRLFPKEVSLKRVLQVKAEHVTKKTIAEETQKNKKIQLEHSNQQQRKATDAYLLACLLYTSPSPRDRQKSRMPSSA